MSPKIRNDTGTSPGTLSQTVDLEKFRHGTSTVESVYHTESLISEELSHYVVFS